jgi:hypothetical protein
LDRVELPQDERLHTDHQHEWWYFAAWLRQPSTGRSFHYTSALMRNDVVWVSYQRWWPVGGTPTLRKAVHAPPRRSEQELWLTPGRDWRVLVSPGGRSTHLLGPQVLHFAGRPGGVGPCLHTPAADGGILTYGGANTMAWYSWPDLEVRGQLQAGDVAANALVGHGWMEHQWGGTDFRRLTWRYCPILLQTPVPRRLVAWRYVHRDHPTEPSVRIAELRGGELHPIAAGTIDPGGPGTGPTVVTLGGGDQLVVTMVDGGAVDLRLPGVPTFHESPSTVTGRLGGVDVTGVAMTEFNPSGSHA